MVHGVECASYTTMAKLYESIQKTATVTVLQLPFVLITFVRWVLESFVLNSLSERSACGVLSDHFYTVATIRGVYRAFNRLAWSPRD